MSTDTVRMSQIVGVFGPGAMVDLPERSVLIMGLGDWEVFGPEPFKKIQEPRLQALLEARLAEGTDNRISAGKPLEFRTPPIDQGDPKRPSPAIKAKVFPEWFACEAIAGDKPNRRRMVRFSELEAPKFLEQRADDGKRRRATPLRFVCGCEKGHLQDIDWRLVVHSARSRDGGSAGPACRKAMWLEESGTSADPRDTKVACECGASLSLEDLFQPQRLGACVGRRPWLGSPDPNGCDATSGLRLLTRSATNTYFPQIARVISLPESSNDLDQRLDDVWSTVIKAASAAELQMARKFDSKVQEALKDFSDEEVFKRIQERLSSQSAGPDNDAPLAENPRLAEFRILASGKALIGENHPAAKLHAETLPRSVWDPNSTPLMSGVASLVAIHRLREVACLYGFTRFEPAPIDDGLEDVGLAINGAPLGESPEWLPAIEQFGEGFFVRFDPAVLAKWTAKPSVVDRKALIRDGADAWNKLRQARGSKPSKFQDRDSAEYVLAHSLAHALMNEVAIDCGYPASSLKERIYLMPALPCEPRECGILIYTASAGTQGTLGGLVEVTHRFQKVLKSALDRLVLCSTDPVCGDHVPSQSSEDRMLHGAACHGCLLVAETSCEMRNIFLDRALLIETVAENGAAFFA